MDMKPISKLVPDLTKLQAQIAPKLDQALQSTQENLAAVDAWAIAQANRVVEQGTDQLHSLTHQAESQYVEKVTAKLDQGRDRLVDFAKTAWNKVTKS